MSPRAKYPGNKGGLPFGAYVLTSLGYPARVAGHSEALRTFVEAWGDGHEVGSEATASLTLISREDFEARCRSFGHDPADIQDRRLAAWERDRGREERDE